MDDNFTVVTSMVKFTMLCYCYYVIVYPSLKLYSSSMYYAAATAITSQTQPAASHQLLNSAITAADAFFASPVEPLPHTDYQKYFSKSLFLF